jgi:hypothetical protein
LPEKDERARGCPSSPFPSTNRHPNQATVILSVAKDLNRSIWHNCHPTFTFATNRQAS